MPAIATLVIYLSAAEAADPGANVLLHSAREILGVQAQVVLRVQDPPLTDEALASASVGSDAAAQVVWLGGEHRRAAIHCYIGNLHRLVEREVAFDEDADSNDRERMLGFVVASMLPSDVQLPEHSPVQTVRPREQPSKTERAAGSSAATSSAPSHFVGLAEVVGLGASGIGGSASGFGAAVGGRWLFARSLSLRIAGGVRRGDIPEASATSEVEFVGLGPALEAPLSDGSRFAWGARASALVLRHEVDHFSSDDRVPDRKSRVLPGVDAFFEASFHFSASAGIVAGAGAELAFGHTDVLVKGKEVADIPPLRALAELGIQAKF
jgi:hypothetical protein